MTQNQEKPMPQKQEESTQGSQLLLGLVFGVVFGFLLQKGGVGHYDILVGALLLRDFTVFKVMLSAILIGMLGIFTMHRFGLVKLHVKPLQWGPNVIGGLVFGLGFGLSGYCPGTGAVGFAQGGHDALFAMLGLMAGSYAYAELSGLLGCTVAKWGDRGKLMLSDIVPAPRPAVIGGMAALLALALFLLARF